jgi:hypothetical protein
MREMISLAPIHPRVVKSANFVMFYVLEPHTITDEDASHVTTYPGWRITLVGIQGAPNAKLVLSAFSDPKLVSGDHGIASTWVPTPAAAIMPFIYP